MSISQKKGQNLKINIERYTIKGKLDNNIKSKLITGVQSRNNKSNIKDESIIRRHNTTNSNRSSSLNTNKSTNTNTLTKSVISTSYAQSKINTSKSSIHSDNTSKIKTLKPRTINRSKEEEEETENIGVNTATNIKRNISNVDIFIRQSKSNLKTGKHLAVGTIKTLKKSKYIIKSNLNRKTKQDLVFNSNNNNLKSNNNSKDKKNDSDKSKPIENIYHNVKDEIIETLDDKNNDLAIRSLVDGYKNIQTVAEVSRRTYNIGLKINNQYKKRKDKEDKYTKIETRVENNPKTKVNREIHTGNKFNKVKTKYSTIKSEKKAKEKLTQSVQASKQAKIISEKIKREIAIVIKKIAEAAAKTKVTIFMVITLVVIFFISMLSAVIGSVSIAQVAIPNIQDSNSFIAEMNRIEAKANEEINAADRFKVEDERNGVPTSWKDVIAVYMAKYENEPPINFGKVNSDTTEEGGTAGDGDTETTFNGTYADLIGVASDKYDVDSNLIAGVIKQESNFNPEAISSAGAEGLMQIMPGNFASLGISNGFDPYQNVMGGAQLLQNLCQMYNNDLTMVLIGYNLGSGNMQRLGINSASDLHKAPSETRSYVPRVIAYYESYKNGTELPDGDVTGVVGQGGGIDNELEAIYRLFNTLTEEEQEIEVDDDDGEGSHTEIIIIVTLTKHNIDYVIDKLNFTDDQKEMAMVMLEADAFDEVLENYDFSFKIRGSLGGTINGGSGLGTIGSGGANGTGEAITDEEFEKLQEYIDDCLGTPYVMGGNTPGVALDCSAFVSYVFREAGVIDGRYTAQGLCNISTRVSEDDLKPGDLIFFQGTYNTSDIVTHIGIYTGNGMMVHSGNPCQYTSFETAYWQEHLYGYGRLT